MASVVFFRALNVGGHQICRPAALARELAEFGVVNVGAAGTFVVRNPVGAARLRAEILRRLPFAPALAICPARDVLAVLSAPLFREPPTEKGVERYFSVLEKAAKPIPPLPCEQPPGGKWEVRLVAVVGRFVLSLRRPGDTYANAVVEKYFKIPATTRNWNTLATIGSILETKRP